ncbi:unnamed protein product, partial [Ectocarpus sp. 12 AP-2014]
HLLVYTQSDPFPGGRGGKINGVSERRTARSCIFLCTSSCGWRPGENVVGTLRGVIFSCVSWHGRPPCCFTWQLSRDWQAGTCTQTQTGTCREDAVRTADRWVLLLFS